MGSLGRRGVGFGFGFGGIRRDENEAHVARIQFDEIKRDALQVGRAGGRDQQFDAIDDEMLVGLAFGIEAHAVVHAAVLVLVGGHAQDHLVYVRVVVGGANLLGCGVGDLDHGVSLMSVQAAARALCART